MKKKNIIIIAIVILVIIAIVATIIVYKNNKNDDTNYEIEEVKQYNYFLLKENDLYGVIDQKGNIIIDATYSQIKIPNPEKGVFVCYQEESSKILNEKKEEILTKYNNVEPIRLKNISSDLMYEKSVLKYCENGKYGLIQFDGKEITKPIYDEIDSLPYKEGEILVKQNENYGVINIKGKELIEAKYTEIKVDEYYTDEDRYKYAGYIVSITTEEGYRYGYLNENAKEVLKTEYNEILRVTEIEDTENIYLICAKNGQYGIIKNGEKILENEYQSIRYDSVNEIFVVEKSKKYGIANLEGKLTVPLQYNQIDITGIYIYAQDSNQSTMVYDKNGVQVVNANPNVSILNTSNEKYKIKINNQEKTKYGIINQEGNQLIEEKYNYIQYLYDNYFIVSNENGKLGIVDDKDTIKIEIDNDSIQKIQDTNLIQTTKDKITKIYDKKMNKICEMENSIIETEGDYIKIYNETQTKYFSKEGIELENTQVYPNNKLFVKVENGKYGFCNSNKETIVDCIYDKACEFNSYGYAAIRKDGKWGVINEDGNVVLEPVYNFAIQTEPFFIGKYYRVIYGFGEFYFTEVKE